MPGAMQRDDRIKSQGTLQESFERGRWTKVQTRGLFRTIIIALCAIMARAQAASSDDSQPSCAAEVVSHEFSGRGPSTHVEFHIRTNKTASVGGFSYVVNYADNSGDTHYLQKASPTWSMGDGGPNITIEDDIGIAQSDLRSLAVDRNSVWCKGSD